MFEKDKELQEYRHIMETPSKFEDGFDMSSFLGTLFLALILVPGCIYMGLVAGMGIGPAAQWVTLILFIEVAKRANAKLSRAQLFVLFYITGMLIGGGEQGLLFRQFLVRSEAAVSSGISSLIPSWVAPSGDAAYANRSFLQIEWLPVIGMIAFTMFFGQLNSMIIGYGLFRQTSDIEKLPFPMAPVGAQGILALAEQIEGSGDGESPLRALRWRLFCIGGAIGMAFSAIYMGIPTLTGGVLGGTISVLPIPFVEWSYYTKDFLPAVATGITLDLGGFITGMVVPFYAVLGSFASMVVTLIANPILYKLEILHLYTPGDSTVEICFKNNIDLYFSLGIGISLAIAIIGIIGVIRHVRQAKKAVSHSPVPAGRGDIPNKFIIFCYVLSTAIYILLSGWLIDWHPGVMIVLIFYGVLYTPMISYVTAKLEGMAGQAVEIPFIAELSFILSGYQGVAIWFIPVPKANYGMQTMFYKKAELLGTRFTSIWKANLLLYPIIVVSSLLFASFIWKLAEIPSSVYPYTERIWELQAKNTCLLYSSTLGEYSPFQDALSLPKVAIGFGLGITFFSVLSALSAPIMLFYGFVGGLGGIPHGILVQFAGAMVGRHYFRKRFGSNWLKIIPVLSAGYFVGGGLIAMLCTGIVFLSKAATTLPY